MRFLENRVPPPLVGALLALAMWLLAKLGPVWHGADAVRYALVALLVLAGLACDVLGIREFRRSRTTVNPLKPANTSTLVTGGIYRVTRNPMYLGMALLLAAWACWLASPWPLLGPVAFLLYIGRFQIEPEERAMRALFGAEFLSYAARVRRWL